MLKREKKGEGEKRQWKKYYRKLQSFRKIAHLNSSLNVTHKLFMQYNMSSLFVSFTIKRKSQVLSHLVSKTDTLSIHCYIGTCYVCFSFYDDDIRDKSLNKERT